MKTICWISLCVGLASCHFRDWSDTEDSAYVYRRDHGWESVRIQSIGRVALNDQGTDVDSISRGGYLRLERKSLLREYAYVVTPKDDGSLDKVFMIQRQVTETDPTTEPFIQEMMDIVRFETPIGAEVRAERLYRSGGADAVIREASRVESNRAKSVLLREGMRQALADSVDARPFLEAAGRSIESSSALAGFLDSASFLKPGDSLWTEDLFRVCESVESNTRRSETILLLAARRTMTPVMLDAALEATASLTNSTKKSETLSGLLPYATSTSSSWSHWLRVIDGIESNTQRSDALQDLLEQPGMTTGHLMEVIDVTRRMESNKQRANVYEKMVRRYPLDDGWLDKLLDALRELDSGQAQERVLTEIIQKPNVSKTVLQRVREAADMLSSQSARLRVSDAVSDKLTGS